VPSKNDLPLVGETTLWVMTKLVKDGLAMTA